MFRLAEMHTFTHPDIQKKAPQSRRRTAGQRVSMGSTLLGRKHEESCSIVNILLILSGMSTGKLKGR